MTLALFVAYLALTIGIGLWSARGASANEEGFFLGGRRLPSFVVALSAVSSGRSAWLVLGASGAAWASGLSAIWLFPGYILAEYVLIARLGPHLRRRSAEAGAITVPEVLARLASSSGGERQVPVRQIAGLIVVAFLITYVSAQLVAGGKALESVFPGLDGKTWGLCITAGIVLFYTWLGGYHAVAVTDVVQGILMIFGLVVLPLVGLWHVGGVGALVETLRGVDPELLSVTHGIGPLVAGVAIGLGSFGSPPILVRTMSIDRAEALPRAARVATAWNVVMAAGAVLTGLVGRAIFTSTDAFPGGDREHLFPMLGVQLSEQYLFSGFVGVLLAALFAAIMSTCDSQLLVIASSFVRDFRKREVERGVATSRLAVLVALVAAVAISFGAERNVKDFVLFSWDALGAAFGPAVLFLMFVPRTGPRAVLAGMVVGVATVVLWGKTPALTALVHQRIPGFAAAALALWLLREAPRDSGDS